jgi:endonuclease-3 related protein
MTANELYEKLLQMYGKPRWWSEDPYVVMFQTILVQNTSWTQVEKTTASIGATLDPRKIAVMSESALEELIRPCGFAKGKAATIKRLTDWFSGYDFSVERTADMASETLRNELLSIKGVGPETADVFMVYAFNRASFIIDAYTRRLLKRLGYHFEADAEIRSFFEDGLPEDYEIYGWLHWLILDHSIQHCKRNPECDGCEFLKCKERR